MSFGFSVTEFVKAGTLAYDLFNACKNASDDYKDLSETCRAVSIAVDTCRPNDPYTVLRQQHVNTITVLAADCNSTLEQLQDLLARYQNMGAVRGFGRKLGFISAKQERDNIRARLQEHLSTINTFSSGVQMETLGLITRLLWKTMEGTGGAEGNTSLQGLIDHPQELGLMLKEFSSGDAKTECALQKDQTRIKDQLKKALDSKSAGDSKLSATNATITQTSKDTISDEPPHTPYADASIEHYNPMDIDWFSAGGSLSMHAVPVDNSVLAQWRPDSAQPRYSKTDEFLCLLPEGWSITPTIARRGEEIGEAYYYVFNNMSCAKDNITRISRVYFHENPFLSDRDFIDEAPTNPTYSTLIQSPVTGKFLKRPAARFTCNFKANARGFPCTKPSRWTSPLAQDVTRLDCVGFVCKNFFWIDLSDDVSRELARAEVGVNGTRLQYSEDVINQSLPENWAWDPDDSGHGQHRYINTENGEETTVHPARFYNPEDDSPLPPGWDRRLDSWGNLFFVDHNTQTTAREDPRYSSAIDIDTGLPQGWRKITDHKGKDFFYRTQGKIVLGTYMSQHMKGLSVKGKKILKAIPKNGEDPHSLDTASRPRDRQRAEERQQSITEQRANSIREPTDEEQRHYYRLFSTMAKQNENFVSFSEAQSHMQSFKILPDIASQILIGSDSNHDGRLNADEYAAALHKVRVTMETTFASTAIAPPNEQEANAYHVMYAAVKKPGELHVTLDEVQNLCAVFELPTELVEKVWSNADVNHDQKYNPDEFATGIHQIFKEVERREAIRMNAGLPTTKTSATANPPPAVLANPVPLTIVADVANLSITAVSDTKSATEVSSCLVDPASDETSGDPNTTKAQTSLGSAMSGSPQVAVTQTK